MNKLSMKSYIIGLLAIYIVSFCGEFVCITYKLHLVSEQSMLNVSILMVTFLVGGILSAPLSIIILDKISLVNILQSIFFFSGAVIISTCISINLYSTFVASFLLGLLSSLFWSALAVIISTIFEEARLEQANKFTHAIRNMGYIAGPSLAGLINGYLDLKPVLFIIACLFWMGMPCIYMLSPMYEGCIKSKPDIVAQKINPFSNICLHLRVLFQLPNMQKTLIPIMITICISSTSNIALLHLILNVLHYSKTIYGVMDGLISLGLIGGPFFFSSLLSKRGEPFGVCIAALIMGGCIAATSLFHSILGLTTILLILGAANGLQNTLMWTFVMKITPKKQSNKVMPIYILILQLTVLVGFLTSSIMDVRHTRSLLALSGCTSLLFGLFGAVLNYKHHRVSDS